MKASTTAHPLRLNLRVGEWVEVRSKDEILQTLDQQAQLDGLPFMPQMFDFCGQRFQVYKRAHKTCDTVFPVRGRRMANAVHLETRCDGQGYEGCQAGCLLFWKEAWLKRVDPNSAPSAAASSPGTNGQGCTVETVLARCQLAGSHDEKGPTYVCQATVLPQATSSLEWWEFSQYWEDLTSGNVNLWQVLTGSIYAVYYRLSVAGIGLGRPLRWTYDRLAPLWGGTSFPRKSGSIPEGQPTPSLVLNLQPGDLVRVKSHEEILKTLNTDNKNRGLFFDAEMVPYCGKTYRVLQRVSKMVDEKTGKMLKLKTEPIILQGAFCQSRYSYCRMFCPRSIYGYWREIWLEKVEESKAVPPSGNGQSAK